MFPAVQSCHRTTESGSLNLYKLSGHQVSSDNFHLGVHDHVVIGTGLAAVGAVRGLLEAGFRPTVVDVSLKLPTHISDEASLARQLPPHQWSERLEVLVSKNSDDTGITQIPEKTLFGSTFYVGKGSLDEGFTCDSQPPPFSYAYGGLSNGWGASFLPPARTDIKAWPIEWSQIDKVFMDVVSAIPTLATKDGLSEEFAVPLNSIPPVTSEFESRLLSQLGSKSRSDGSRFIAGKARLAIDFRPDSDNSCVRCGLCMSGCLNQSIYKASTTFDAHIAQNKINFIGGVRIDSIHERDEDILLRGRRLNGSEVVLVCRRLFVAAGAVSTARLLLNSSSSIDGEECKTSLSVKTRGGFVMPVFSWRAIDKASGAPSLPNIFIEYRLNSKDRWVHVQLSFNNELLAKRLKRVLMKFPFGDSLFEKIDKHMGVALVNLHSDYSGTYEIERSDTQNVVYSQYKKDKLSTLAVCKHFIFIFRNFLRGGLIPMPLMIGNYGSYHVGGTIPMSDDPTDPNTSDLLGRPKGYRSVHVVDSSIFPDLPSTTVGLLSTSIAYKIVRDLYASG